MGNIVYVNNKPFVSESRGRNSLPDDEAIAPCLDPIAGRA